MPRADDPVFERLLAKMRSGAKEPMPSKFRQVNRALEELRGPLTFVPHGTVVSMKIEVPNNLSGQHYGLVWVCDEPAGLACQDARQQLMELLVPRFLDLTLPLPD